MAIIYSYPKKTTPNAGDFLVITDSAQAAPNKNRTKSLTIDNLASYVVSLSGNITGGGTLNTIPLFTPNGEEIGDSIMTFTTGPDKITVGGRLVVTGDLVAQGRSDFTGLYARFGGEVRDGSNLSGTAGQVLSSTGTGVAPVNLIADAVAIIVCEQKITSSPTPMPPAFNNNCRASVAFPTPIAYRIFRYSEILVSKSDKSFCIIYAPRSPISLYMSTKLFS